MVRGEENVLNNVKYVMISLEELVSEDHLNRKVDEAMDFTFIYLIIESTYSA
ncbi:hypothetical protein [Enterococcus caccae]|uniref:hypothetical protein n=1 Tax=Enterococcus caccae TaxID=317735 RepID=UPI00039EAE04|nr:hypothetical protein [Enterococcus caccae]OJG23363.1 hypothetical protein RU98_GL001858 [Enterococcus caccae]